ncbi:MAG: MFS transporter [Acetobacteraceae bacterium]|nr:MFS transporter [Acetobacteraceae bacterium]
MIAASLAPWFNRHGIHYGWVMVALTFLTAVCASAATSLPSILLLPMMQEFGWARADVSGAMGLMLILFAVTVPFAGALMLRHGLSRIVVAAAIMTAIALFGTTQVTARWQLWITLGLLLGTAAGLVALVLSATVANRWFAQRRGLAMGILTAAFAAGQLSFMPAAAWLATNHGWRMAVWPAIIGAGVCAVLYILLARDWPADVGLPPYGEEQIQPPVLGSAENVINLSFSALRDASLTRVFWVLAGSFFICGLSTTGVVNQHFVPFCADNGVTAVVAASFLALMGVFNFAGTICSGWLSDRFDNRILLAWYYGLRGLSLMWLPFSNFDVVSLSLFAIFFGLDFVATVPPTVKLAAQHFGPVKAPIVFGWAFASHQLGGAVSAYASGVSRDAWATYLPAYLAIGFACLLAAMAVFAVRDIRQATLRAAE